MIILYGIKNCDTVKKARNWLEQNQIDYQFHDYRSDGLELSLLEHFEATLGWETLVNKRSASWRQLSDEQKNTLDKTSAMAIMLEMPTLIKRPILDNGSTLLIGFKASEYQQL